jgi:hypothetical protein
MRRAERHFRQHVDTPSNRRAGRSCRIVRQPCFFCVEEERARAAAGGVADESRLFPAPFHHLSYTPGEEFRGVWCCDKHHRQIDHGPLRIPLRAVRDYSSDVGVIARVGARGPRQRVRANAHDSSVPF